MKRKGWLLLPPQFKNVLEIQAISQVNKLKSYDTGKKDMQLSLLMYKKILYIESLKEFNFEND